MSRLTSRAWVIVGLLAAVVILAAAWLVVIGPTRADAEQLRTDTEDVQTQNVVLTGQTTKLRELASHKGELVADLESALSGLPSGAGLPVFSRQLATQATAQGVTLTGVSVGSPVSPNASTGGAATGATSAQAIPVTVTATGSATQLLLFQRDVEKQGPRLALVTSTSIVPAGDPTGTGDDAASTTIEDHATLTLQVTVFTNPLSKATREQLDEFATSN